MVKGPLPIHIKVMLSIILKKMNIPTSVTGKKEMIEAQKKMGRTTDGDFFDSGYDLNYLY